MFGDTPWIRPCKIVCGIHAAYDHQTHFPMPVKAQNEGNSPQVDNEEEI